MFKRCYRYTHDHLLILFLISASTHKDMDVFGLRVLAYRCGGKSIFTMLSEYTEPSIYRCLDLCYHSYGDVCLWYESFSLYGVVGIVYKR